MGQIIIILFGSLVVAVWTATLWKFRSHPVFTAPEEKVREKDPLDGDFPDKDTPWSTVARRVTTNGPQVFLATNGPMTNRFYEPADAFEEARPVPSEWEEYDMSVRSTSMGVWLSKKAAEKQIEQNIAHLTRRAESKTSHD
jgi:hypothetical protein